MATRITISTPTKHTAEVRGGRALQLLRRARVPHLFAHRPPSGGAPCWTCPAPRIADVVAAAEMSRGLHVVVLSEQQVLPL